MIKKYKVLLFIDKNAPNSFILEDCKIALSKLDCEVLAISVGSDVTEVKAILSTLQPDFILCLNHQGVNDNIFSEQKVPYFSWMTDNPFYCINESCQSPYAYVLVTDKAYFVELARYGFKSVFYLPPASSPERMHSMEHLRLRSMDISLLDTLGRPYKEWRRERNREAKPPTREILDLLVHLKIQKPNLTFDEMFTFCDEKFKHKILQNLDMKARGSIEFRIDAETTAYFKETYLLASTQDKVTVFGDSAWKKITSGLVYYAGPVDYARDAGNIYRLSKINLNIIPTHIQTGVNQKLLDIAATGAIFLTNSRKHIQDFFDIDLRYLIYTSENDLREKAEYFLKSNEIRIMVGNELFESIYHKHTYEHRMKELLDIFRQVTA